MHRAPHARWRCRHFDVFDAVLRESVDDGVDDGGRGADGAGFTCALHADRVAAAAIGQFVQIERRHVIGARHAIVEVTAGHQLPALFVIDTAFGEGLADALRDPDSRVRKNAASALGLIKDVLAVEPLMVALANDASAEVRCEIAAALGHIQDPKAVSALITALRDPLGRVRVCAIEALREIHDPKVVESLIYALRDSNLDVRYQVQDTLRDITGMDFGSDVEKWLSWLNQLKKQGHETK